MQARRLGGARSASRTFSSIFNQNHIHSVLNSSLMVTGHTRCFTGSVISHRSLDRRHSSLVPANMVEPPPIPRRRSRGCKVAPTAMEVMEARLSLLKTLIAATEGKTGLNSKQKVRRDKHIWEKAQIEIRIEAHSNNQTFAQAASTNRQPPVASVQNNITVPLSTQPMGLRSANTPAAQTNAQRIAAINGLVYQLPARPSFTPTNRRLQHSVPDLNTQITLPLRPAQTRKRDRSPIVRPSAASGGVPDPSQMYMSISAMEPQASSMPQHLLLVIDLNGTLLYRPNKNTPYHFVERPSAQQFLNYALANFSVMIWSSARPENVDRMCNELFSEKSRQQLVAVWGRDRLGLSTADSKKRVQVYKRLEKVWNDPQIQGRHPLASEGKGWHQGNTVLIDDSVEKSRSEPYNFLEVPEFTGHRAEDPNLLREIAEYLAILRMHTNVSSYILRNPLVRRNSLNKQDVAASPANNNGQVSITQDDSLCGE